MKPAPIFQRIIAILLLCGVPLASYAQVMLKEQSEAVVPTHRIMKLDNLVQSGTVVDLDTTVTCTNGGKKVKCPAKILILNTDD